MTDATDTFIHSRTSQNRLAGDVLEEVLAVQHQLHLHLLSIARKRIGLLDDLVGVASRAVAVDLEEGLGLAPPVVAAGVDQELAVGVDFGFSEQILTFVYYGTGRMRRYRSEHCFSEPASSLK